ncbi:MAG: hypothetical protein FWE94_08305 [Coriobacteriia bacterium]|nr:hypothetical protein [Coriobacteriia bacterium]
MGKKLLSLALALIMMFAFATPALAAPSSQIVDGPDRIWQDGFGYHCNAAGGNGQTSVTYAGNNAAVKAAIGNIKKQPAGSMLVLKGDQKDIFGTKTYPIRLERLDDTTCWNLVTGDDIVCATCGRTDWVTYSNNSGTIAGKNIQAHHPILPPPPETHDAHCRLSVQKTVDDMVFGEWASDNDIDVAELISGISFKVFATDADGGSYDEADPIGIGTLTAEGKIVFLNLPDDLSGWVAIVEYIVPGSLADDLFKNVGSQYFFITGVDAEDNFIVKGNEVGFDFDALYELKGEGDIYSLLAEGDTTLNARGNVQKISVKDVDGEDWLSSFCANGTSVSFGDSYKAANELARPKDLAKTTAALNYIFNKYGSVDSYGGWGNGDKWSEFAMAISEYENGDDAAYIALMSQQTRLLSQIAIWTFYSGFEIDIAWYSGGHRPGIPDQYKIAIDDLLENGLSGSGDLKLAYLVCAEGGLDHITSCQPQFVPYFGSDSFDNKTKEESASLSLAKTVDGVAFDAWLDGYKGDKAALLAGVSFALYAADTDSVRTRVFDPAGSEPIVTSGVSAESGLIDFTAALKARAGGLLADYYWVVEVLSGPAVDVFEPVAPLLVYIGESGIAVSSGFDYDVLYTVVNGYGSGYTLGYPGLNNTGDIFPIAVTNSVTGVVYPSFCANAGSTHFAGDSGLECTGYMVASRVGKELADYADFVSAYNYIEDNYGGLEGSDGTLKGRALTQTVTWVLLGAIDVNSPEFNAIADSKLDKAAVLDVITNSKGYVGKGKIADLVFMVCEKHEHSYQTCQPQLVPVYSKTGFDNKTRDDYFNSGSFNKTVYGGGVGLLPKDFGGFAFDLFKVVGEDEALLTEADVSKDATFVGSRYYTDSDGKVSFVGLKPGSYVFREVFKTYGIGGDPFKLIFKPKYPGNADGLYFTVDAKGDVTWRDSSDEAPTVDNVFWNKNIKMWIDENEYISMEKGEYIDGGYICYPGGEGVGEEVHAVYVPASCLQDAVVQLYYYEGGAPLGSIVLEGTATGHGHWVLTELGDGLYCGNVNCQYKLGWDAFTRDDEDLITLYLGLLEDFFDADKFAASLAGMEAAYPWYFE